MTPSRRAPDNARRNESTRQAILNAALELVSEVGYAKLSVEGIAARAGAGKQTIYRWWPSKGAVLFDALLALSGGQEGETGELPDTGDLEADLRAVLRATADELNDPRYSEPMRALTVEVLVDPDLAADYQQRLEEPVREMKRRRLRSAQDVGQLSPGVDLDVAVDMIWGPVRSRWLHRDGPLTEEYVDVVVRTALQGLRAPDIPEEALGDQGAGRVDSRGGDGG
ncbi:TetR family transcriptional regulator [Streptomyces sp. 3MP-14]|uniref:TetR family transcriptional regulator n=1 Tax=Streptomyces mimosae TaxID=2586635 RepID=A0A5N6ATB9_9ACTN|nr:MULTISPECIES: TetR/AcrR family transcriptional regulator [Streptomyces]KAB8170948.1 TetR family transcriptional regulator [Streptomyces mimosae]KAB8179701.1 TetR family transcriptional regulator [Streptomyces sp. 3MP-14]